ncbi:VOC family protein [Nonomuraea sp. NPDC049309]|uniref:VOC family protein n=1 Tax=Nonomuraea sp. NPDC049309 TaxID=3364350 RepID=UPI003715FCE7
MAAGMVHHIEIWVPDLGRAVKSWGWLLEALGYAAFQDWPDGRSWRLGETYVVVEQSPALTSDRHERLRPGLNHLAFHAGGRERVDELVEEAAAYGWTLMFPDRHPYAGGDAHYAAYLENEDGFEVELVATT